MIIALLAALQILVTLTAPTSGPTPESCSLERKIDSGSYQEIVAAQSCNSTYTDTVTGTTISYRSRSTANGAKSAYSAEAVVSTGSTQPPPTGGSPLPAGYTFFSAEYGRMVMSQSGSLAFGSSAAGFYFRNALAGEIIYCQRESFPGAPYIGNPSCFFKAN